jgi:hypothetical protein
VVTEAPIALPVSAGEAIAVGDGDSDILFEADDTSPRFTQPPKEW